MENKTNKMAERRENLKKTSNTVKELMAAGKLKATNINDGLLEHYSGKAKNRVYMTLEQWQAAGYQVRKGETAQMIWGKKEESTNKETNEAYTYFQINFVFNNTQVDRQVRNFKETTPATEESGSTSSPDNSEDMPF